MIQQHRHRLQCVQQLRWFLHQRLLCLKQKQQQQRQQQVGVLETATVSRCCCWCCCLCERRARCLYRCRSCRGERASLALQRHCVLAITPLLLMAATDVAEKT